MTVHNPDPNTIRAELNDIANGGESRYLTDFYGRSLDGSDIAKYLSENCSLTVSEYRDTGSCGLVTLSSGVCVSTNGYCYKPKNLD